MVATMVRRPSTVAPIHTASCCQCFGLRFRICCPASRSRLARAPHSQRVAPYTVHLASPTCVLHVRTGQSTPRAVELRSSSDQRLCLTDRRRLCAFDCSLCVQHTARTTRQARVRQCIVRSSQFLPPPCSCPAFTQAPAAMQQTMHNQQLSATMPLTGFCLHKPTAVA